MKLVYFQFTAEKIETKRSNLPRLTTGVRAKIQIYFMENALVSKYQPTSIKGDSHYEGKSGTSRKTSMSRMRGLSNVIHPVRDQ